MSKYITWRELNSLSLGRARELSEAGKIWITADGSVVFRLVEVRSQNDNQAMADRDTKEVGQAIALTPIDNQGSREPIKPGSLEMYRPGYHKVGDHVLMWKNRKLVEAIVPELDGEGQTIPRG